MSMENEPQTLSEMQFTNSAQAGSETELSVGDSSARVQEALTRRFGTSIDIDTMEMTTSTTWDSHVRNNLRHNCNEVSRITHDTLPESQILQITASGKEPEVFYDGEGSIASGHSTAFHRFVVDKGGRVWDATTNNFGSKQLHEYLGDITGKNIASTHITYEDGRDIEPQSAKNLILSEDMRATSKAPSTNTEAARPNPPKEIPQEQLLDRVKEKAPGKYDFDHLSEEDRLWLTNVMDERNDQGFQEWLKRHEKSQPVSTIVATPEAVTPKQAPPTSSTPPSTEQNPANKPDLGERVIWKGEEMTRHEAELRQRLWDQQEKRDAMRRQAAAQQEQQVKEQAERRAQEIQEKATPFTVGDCFDYLRRKEYGSEEEEQLARARWERTPFASRATAAVGTLMLEEGPKVVKGAAKALAFAGYGTAREAAHLVDAGAKALHDFRNSPERLEAQRRDEYARAREYERRRQDAAAEKKSFNDSWRALEEKMQDSGTGMSSYGYSKDREGLIRMQRDFALLQQAQQIAAEHGISTGAHDIFTGPKSADTLMREVDAKRQDAHDRRMREVGDLAAKYNVSTSTFLGGDKTETQIMHEIAVAQERLRQEQQNVTSTNDSDPERAGAPVQEKPSSKPKPSDQTEAHATEGSGWSSSSEPYKDSRDTIITPQENKQPAAPSAENQERRKNEDDGGYFSDMHESQQSWNLFQERWSNDQPGPESSEPNAGAAKVSAPNKEQLGKKELVDTHDEDGPEKYEDSVIDDLEGKAPKHDVEEELKPLESPRTEYNADTAAVYTHLLDSKIEGYLDALPADVQMSTFNQINEGLKAMRAGREVPSETLDLIIDIINSNDTTETRGNGGEDFIDPNTGKRSLRS